MEMPKSLDSLTGVYEEEKKTVQFMSPIFQYYSYSNKYSMVLAQQLNKLAEQSPGNRATCFWTLS